MKTHKHRPTRRIHSPWIKSCDVIAAYELRILLIKDIIYAKPYAEFISKLNRAVNIYERKRLRILAIYAKSGVFIKIASVLLSYISKRAS